MLVENRRFEPTSTWRPSWGWPLWISPRSLASEN